MSLRVPLNQIVANKYTSGKEYIYKTSYKEYIGYYYELNGKVFAGREFKYNAPILIKINSDSINLLKLNPKTQRYSAISNQQIFKEDKIVSLPFNNLTNLYDRMSGDLFLNFFCKKIESNSISIKVINEDTYKKLSENNLYSVTYIGEYNGIYQTIEEADKIMNGLSIFLLERNL